MRRASACSARISVRSALDASSQGTNLLPSIGGVPYIISLNGPTSPYTHWQLAKTRRAASRPSTRPETNQLAARPPRA